MEVRRAYCSAVDHLVPVVLRARPAPDGSRATSGSRLPDVDPADLYCLDYKVRCSGWCCPLFSTSDEPLEDEPEARRPRRWSRHP